MQAVGIQSQTADPRWVSIYFNVQQYAALIIKSFAGFKDLNLGNSLGWWAATVATYCQSSSSQLTQKNITKQGKRVDENGCSISVKFRLTEAQMNEI